MANVAGYSTSPCVSANGRGGHGGEGEIPASIPELLARRRAEPDGELLVTDDERLTFGEADATSLELADALLASGVGKGTRVGILFPNCHSGLSCGSRRHESGH